MKTKNSILFFMLIFLFIFFNESINSQVKKYSIAALVDETDGPEFVSIDDIGNIDLLPGQIFTGWMYFWATNGTISANYQIVPPVNWLIMTPSSFTSTGCTDIKAISFIFTAPTSPGYYTTTAVDQNNNWGTVNINLTVTSNPANYKTDSIVYIRTDSSACHYHASWYHFSNPLGCDTNYHPGPTSQTIHTLIPPVPWMNINPSNFTVPWLSTIVAQKTFQYSTVGVYTTLECKTKQYYTFPTFIKWILFVNPPVGVKINNNEIPDKFELFQNYPNPFNPSTKIEFTIPLNNLQVKLSVYDILGKEIAVLANEKLHAGIFSYEWNASNYPSGVYFYKLEAGYPESTSKLYFAETKKLILLK